MAAAMMALGARVACAQAVPAQRAPQDTMPMAVVHAYVDAFNAHDLDGMLSFIASDVVWLSITGDSVSVGARGVADLRGQMSDYFRRLPSARSELEERTVVGPWVSARERAHWAGAAGPRSQAALAVYEVRAGLIQRVWYFPVVR
jgi:hypothetical protein